MRSDQGTPQIASLAKYTVPSSEMSTSRFRRGFSAHRYYNSIASGVTFAAPAPSIVVALSAFTQLCGVSREISDRLR
ncbi:hypothetical protein ThimaDRAFT_1966 [Thiocapsa marina 5811]|uniref:Uncharacterized protein n=1 Tax=Thiocapsa marina 5811 TaxID=768671 RepID=F9UAT0_9GAMM|nr:hypothetical protein ThimaDRAFT_1966 [Thiocapsa marina 5811]